MHAIASSRAHAVPRLAKHLALTFTLLFLALHPSALHSPAGAPRFQYHFATIREETRDGDTTATVTPNQTGWSDGDTTSPDTGTFLVREH